jgi:hypothetical protein
MPPGATIILDSPGNEIIADDPRDRIVCAAHASHELIEIAKGEKVSKRCKGHHNEIEPAPPLRAHASAASAHALLGDGHRERHQRGSLHGAVQWQRTGGR